MTERVGVKVIPGPSRPGLGAGPVIPTPSTEAQRIRAAEQAGKVAKLLAKPSPAQVALFRRLAESSPEGGYVVREARWIDTILKATKGLSAAEMQRLHDFDWTERNVPPGELRKQLVAALKIA